MCGEKVWGWEPADSRHGLGRSPVISSPLFASLPPFDTLPVKIPLEAASHALFYPHFPFCPHSHHQLTAFCAPYLIRSFLPLFFSSVNFPTLPLPFSFVTLFRSEISHKCAVHPAQRCSTSGLSPTKCLRRLSPWAHAGSVQSFSCSWLTHLMATGHW